MNEQSTSPRSFFIFLDEGGNFDFSPTGTEYFTLTSVTLVRPFQMAGPLDDLKYDLIESGLEIEYFHASEDKQTTRDGVFKIVQQHLRNIQIDTLIVEKRKTMPHLQAIHKFYPKMLGYLLCYPLERPLLDGYRTQDVDEVVIITDQIPFKKKRNLVEGVIKQNLKKILPDTSFRIMHHSSKSSMELQIADYCNWAIFKKWNSGDRRSYDLIKGGIRSEFNIFAGGERFYY
ncbi:MAG: DUF3800 domain-containing protein [Nitrospinaceae bacterium]|nr:DUF3800 domain-containing protein [Nitrospinaceae bacterium]